MLPTSYALLFLYYLCKVPSMLSLLPLCQLNQRWSWGGVSSVSSVQVENDAGISGPGRKRGPAGRWYTAAQLGCTRALNLEVHTLWVCLCAVDLACRMEGDDLVADDIVSWCKVGNGEAP